MECDRGSDDEGESHGGGFAEGWFGREVVLRTGGSIKTGWGLGLDWCWA